MNPPPTTNLYKRHRFPAEIISHCVWLYFRFCLSYRDVEELMAQRGVILIVRLDHRFGVGGLERLFEQANLTGDARDGACREPSRRTPVP